MERFLAVIPAFNEAAHIAAVVGPALRNVTVLVVDDGSGDETARVAENAGASVLRQARNQGKGAALRCGFRYALEHGYTAVVTLDADGQHDPAEIPKFLEAFAAQPADLIIGARNFAAMPLVRRVSNTTGRWLLNWALGQPILDNQSGYRLLSRRLMAALLDSTEEGFEFEVEMIATCLSCGYILAWTPIRTIYAGEASHIRPGRHAMNFLRVVWKARKTRSQVVVRR
ncbi:MAG: glycosyltransferase family 2 protein [Anaerolineaceae bacterium]|nr:glycosyltransferase family 2 protein [Anaerolineaceae bacterium]